VTPVMTEGRSFVDRLRTAILKPAGPDNVEDAREPMPVKELETTIRSANDKERLIGLVAAPLAAAIGFLIISALVSNDPAALLKDGAVNKLHVAVSVYESLFVVLLVMSVLILATALFRKRLFLGIVMALYGLAVFNLHYWGFGVPFIMAGAWLLVRAYRFQRELRDRESTGGATASFGPPRANKRYTPSPSAGKR